MAGGRERDRRRRDPGALEAEVLSALWASQSPLSPAEVRDTLPGDLAYTTVMTTLTRLYEKGVVSRQRVGRTYVYEPVTEEARHLAGRMQALVEASHNRGAVFSRFVDQLSPADSRMLADLLREAEGG